MVLLGKGAQVDARLEIVLISMQGRCMVCMECTICSKVKLEAPNRSPK